MVRQSRNIVGPHFWRGEKALLNYHTWRIIVTSSDVDKDFLYYVLQALTSQIEEEAHGAAALVHTQKNRIEKYCHSFPPLTEQRAIAATLLTWDRGIRKVSDLIAAKICFKQGLMQQLLTGKRRFERFRDEWRHRCFGDFLTESRIPGSNGAAARKLTIRLYGKGIIPKSDKRPGSKATQFYQRTAGQFIYSKLDFLNGAFGIVPPSLDGYESSLDLPAFDVAPSIDSRWLLYFVTRQGFYRNQLGLAHGGRKARRVNPGGLLRLSVFMPAKREQVRIADALETLDNEINLLRRELDALKNQKNGLMQKLLTGQVRVKP
jgi:type I restriction enzyme, S subunit